MSWLQIQTSIILKCHLLIFYATTTNLFLIRLWGATSGFYTTNWWPPAQQLGWEEAPKHFPKPNSHQKKAMVTSCGLLPVWLDFSDGSDGKASAYNARDLGSIPELERSPGEGNGYPLQYSCLKNSMDRGAWRAIQYTGLQRVRHNWATFTHTHMCKVFTQNSARHIVNAVCLLLLYVLY